MKTARRYLKYQKFQSFLLNFLKNIRNNEFINRFTFILTIYYSKMNLIEFLTIWQNEKEKSTISFRYIYLFVSKHNSI